MNEALALFEQAVVAAPNDPEALSLLAEAYAKQVHTAPGLHDSAELLLERAAYLSNEVVGTPSYLRAQGWLAYMSGDHQGAMDAVGQCGLPVANAGKGAADLGCALLVSLLDARLSGMTELGRRYPDVHAVQVVWAQAALDGASWVKQKKSVGIYNKSGQIHPGCVNWPGMSHCGSGVGRTH